MIFMSYASLIYISTCMCYIIHVYASKIILICIIDQCVQIVQNHDPNKFDLSELIIND